MAASGRADYAARVPVQSPPTTPSEPEIQTLRRIARLGLMAIRLLFWLIGANALYTGLFGPPEWTGLEWETTHLFVFACAGLPLVLPASWWMGRRWWLALLVGCAMWFLPMLADTDHQYGFLLRIFATGVACATIVVWRTLWRLTAAPVVSAGPPSP